MHPWLDERDVHDEREAPVPCDILPRAATGTCQWKEVLVRVIHPKPVVEVVTVALLVVGGAATFFFHRYQKLDYKRP